MLATHKGLGNQQMRDKGVCLAYQVEVGPMHLLASHCHGSNSDLRNVCQTTTGGRDILQADAYLLIIIIIVLKVTLLILIFFIVFFIIIICMANHCVISTAC